VPRCIQRVDDVQTVLAIVAAGLGVSLLPLRSADVRSQGVRFVPLQHAAARWQVGLAWRPQPQNAVVERFVEMVQPGLATTSA
jgi:DNA-binding transcriptional LysR family regulator